MPDLASQEETEKRKATLVNALRILLSGIQGGSKMFAEKQNKTHFFRCTACQDVGIVFFIICISHELLKTPLHLQERDFRGKARGEGRGDLFVSRVPSSLGPPLSLSL